MAKDPFTDEIIAWASEAQYWASAEAAKKTRYLFQKVIEFSPEFPAARYSSGHFIKNWQVGTFPIRSVLPGDSSRVQKITEVNSIVDDEFFLASPDVYFCNNTPYAWQVEEAGWYENGQNTAAYRPVEKGIEAWQGSAPIARATAASM